MDFTCSFRPTSSGLLKNIKRNGKNLVKFNTKNNIFPSDFFNVAQKLGDTPTFSLNKHHNKQRTFSCRNSQDNQIKFAEFESIPELSNEKILTFQKHDLFENYLDSNINVKKQLDYDKENINPNHTNHKLKQQYRLKLQAIKASNLSSQVPTSRGNIIKVDNPESHRESIIINRSKSENRQINQKPTLPLPLTKPFIKSQNTYKNLQQIRKNNNKKYFTVEAEQSIIKFKDDVHQNILRRKVGTEANKITNGIMKSYMWPKPIINDTPIVDEYYIQDKDKLSHDILKRRLNLHKKSESVYQNSNINNVSRDSQNQSNNSLYKMMKRRVIDSELQRFFP